MHYFILNVKLHEYIKQQYQYLINNLYFELSKLGICKCFYDGLVAKVSNFLRVDL